MNDDDKQKLNELINASPGAAALKFAINTISGVIPFVGGAISGAASAWSDEEQKKINSLLQTWLALQEDEIKEIGMTMYEILARLDLTDEAINARMQSPEYLSLVKKAFRDWSAAESENKRKLIRNLLSNAAGASVTGDDVISMFLTWIDRYSEMHFKVIAAIYKNQSISRLEVWQEVDDRQVTDSSADADLFKFIFHELTTGYVIRQHREVDYQGKFVKAQRARNTRPAIASNTYVSPFEDGKQYELTELGKQFVHYTMNEIVPRINASGNST